jgi:wobble nucleotide-excising tRNase
MIQYLKLLRQIGQFDAVNAGGQLPLTKLTLVYAENSRGKTTLAAILRSLKTGDGSLISERHRLPALDPPQVVLSQDGSPPYVFQAGARSATLPDVVIFDDVFVAENICSGIEVAAPHRQKLHELIVGAQGVALNSTLQGLIEKIEANNQALRTTADAIPAAQRGPFSVDAFCALVPVADISAAIREAEQRLAAAQSADAVQREAAFTRLELPPFDVTGLNELLQGGPPEFDAEAAAFKLTSKSLGEAEKIGSVTESNVSRQRPRGRITRYARFVRKTLVVPLSSIITGLISVKATLI